MEDLNQTISPTHSGEKNRARIFKIILSVLVLVVILEGVLYFYFSKRRSKSQTTEFTGNEQVLVDLGTSNLDMSTGEDGVTSVWISGFIVSHPYLKDGSYYLPLVFTEKETRLEGDLLLGEEKGMIGSFIKESDSGEIEGERTLQARQISEILPFLQSGIVVKFQIAVNFDRNKFAIYREKITCDDNCLRKVALLENYSESNREFVKSLFGEGGERKIIGPIIQIEIPGDDKIEND